jgi:spore germination protein YaaH
MLYDYHWPTSPPGPIAPIGWTNDVLSFASTIIPQEKIVHGIPLYGYDWIGNSADSHMWVEIQNIISTYNPTVNWDFESASSWFEYTDSGIRHEVWFEDSSSTDVKIDSTNSHDVFGVHFWRLGGEDPATWDIIRAKFYQGSGRSRIAS